MKLEKKHKIPKCKKCKTTMEWKGSFRIGLYTGGIAVYECPTCNKVKEVEVKPTKYAKKKNKAIEKRIRANEKKDI